MVGALMISSGCSVCGGTTEELVCSVTEIQQQRRYLETFHRKRRHDGTSGRADRTDFTQNNSTDIVACANCGLVWRKMRPTADSATTVYADDHYGEEHLTREHENQRRWAEDKCRTLSTWIHRAAPLIVEVGSFVGGFLAAGRQRRWNMLGIDPGKEVTAFCAKRGLPVFRGALVDASLDLGSADAVTIWNTFDQLPNPNPTLSEARRILRQRGVLVLRIPNGLGFRRALHALRHAAWPMNRGIAAAMAWNNLLGFPYVYGYTLSTLDTLLARHDFARVAVFPDQLIPLADGDATPYALWEERVLKWYWQSFSSLRRWWNKSDVDIAPWLDVYYRPSVQ